MDQFGSARPEAAFWQDIARKYGLFSAVDAAAILQITPRSLHELVAIGGVMAVPMDDAEVFPGFQFTEAGQVIGGLPPLVRAFREHGLTPRDLTFWLLQPAASLHWKRPLDRLLAGHALWPGPELPPGTAALWGSSPAGQRQHAPANAAPAQSKEQARDA